ncbi:Ribonuclease H1 [Tolypocladium capitatum]|uniref:ribonuclease H n=1 Tax=Tolypocladium capitatum TaxID=45235 RepID=A0A2K3Q4I8_9HYPO|nr:Ribonuclease H1 [Tolypocladium capitatum]
MPPRIQDMDDSDSDDNIGAVELPDGRLICRRHGWTVCPYCCFDFSFMDELLEDPEERLEREDNELYEQLSDETRAEIDARWGPPPSTRANAQDSPQSNNQSITGIDARPRIIDADASPEPNNLNIRRGTGRVFPTKFTPPSATSTPGALFPAGIGRQAIPPVARFIRRDYPEQALIYVDGACLNNGQANPKAGWAFVFKPETNQPAGIVSARLEKKGPFGDESTQTSNRAELRAVLGALRFRHWEGEGFTTLVFATDSEYVAEGATTWARGWVRNGWKTHSGAEVKNKDLWEMLLGEVERWDRWGLKIQFWRIPRMLNVTADRAAKQAAEEEDLDEYCEIMGVLT